MRYFAAHRVLLADRKEMLFLCRVGVDSDHDLVTVEPLRGEMSRTEWLGGLIIVSPIVPEREEGECFSPFCSRLYNQIQAFPPSAARYAFYATNFNVSDMEFMSESHFLRLL